MPASTNARTRSGVAEAGPIVATIFVRRGVAWAISRRVAPRSVMVAPVHEHDALIPSADRSALLAVDGRLPVVRLEEAGIRPALTTVEREHGVRAPFLRVVRRAEEGEDVTTLLELDTPA